MDGLRIIMLININKVSILILLIISFSFNSQAKEVDKINCQLIDSKTSHFSNEHPIKFLKNRASKLILISVLNDKKLKLQHDYGTGEKEITFQYKQHLNSSKQVVYTTFKHTKYKNLNTVMKTDPTVDFLELSIRADKSGVLKMFSYDTDDTFTIYIYGCKKIF